MIRLLKDLLVFPSKIQTVIVTEDMAEKLDMSKMCIAEWNKRVNFTWKYVGLVKENEIEYHTYKTDIRTWRMTPEFFFKGMSCGFIQIIK